MATFRLGMELIQRVDSNSATNLLFLVAGKLRLSSLGMVYTSNRKLAGEIGISDRAVGKSMNKLIDVGLVKKGNGKVMVNPKCFWVGSTGERVRGVAIWEKL